MFAKRFLSPAFVQQTGSVVAARVATTRSLSSIDTSCIVNSHNEFDPLEEVIVGRVEGSTIPEWHVSGKAVSLLSL
jgi:hypothetical protein